VFTARYGLGFSVNRLDTALEGLNIWEWPQRCRTAFKVKLRAHSILEMLDTI